MRLGCVAMAAAAALLVTSASARPERLTPPERARLEAGETVTFAESISRGERRYVGGVAYTIVDAPAADLAAVLDDVADWEKLLPDTRSARKVGEASGDDLVEVTHGSALVQVTYTMRVHRERGEMRFWMDPVRPHDIEDMWGFFRTAPLAGDRTLLTYGILVDMGSGLLRDLFEDPVREAALSVPERLRNLVLEAKSAKAARSLVARGRHRY